MACGLFDAAVGPRDLRALFAVVELGKHRALGDALADIGAQVDQHAGDLESDLRRDPRLDRAEPENLHRHIVLYSCDLYLDRPKVERPRSKARRRNGEGNRHNYGTFPYHRNG